MTYEQVVSKVKAKYSDIDASSIEGTQAIQINLSVASNYFTDFASFTKRRTVSTSPEMLTLPVV